MHDGSMLAYDTLRYGSLRLWDAGVTWPDIETSPGVYDWSRLDSLRAPPPRSTASRSRSCWP